MANSPSSYSQPPPGWEAHAQFSQSSCYEYKQFYDQAGLTYMYETGASLSRSESDGTVSSSADREYDGEEQWSPTVSVGDSKKRKKRAQKPKQEIDKAAHLLKRRGQNRASQRAFRERKERHMKELEIKVMELVNLLDSANLENSVAKCQITRMENELSYYRHLLFASQTRNDASMTPENDISDNPSFSRSRKSAYSSAFRPSMDSENHVSTLCDSFNFSTGPPISLISSASSVLIKDEYTPSSTDTCSTPVETFGHPYSPRQSPLAISGSQASLALAMVGSQSSRTFARNIEDSTWGMNVSSWANGDNFCVDSQEVDYQQ